MTTMRQQMAWLLCLLAGIWLGVRAGGASSEGDASHSLHEKNKTADASTGGSTSSGKQRSGVTADSAAASTSAKKTEKPVKRTTLDELRRLLAVDLYDCDLERTFHDMETVVRGLATADLPAAAAMLWTSPRRIWEIMCLTNVLSRWAEAEPRAPLNWLRGLKSDGRIPQLLRQDLLMEIGRKHPDLLWEELMATQEWLSDGWLGSGMMAQGFASDLKLAQKFLDTVSDPSVRYFAMSAVVGELANKDPAAAIAWARSQPRSDAGDQIIASLHRRLAEKNPDAAFALLNNTSTPLTGRERERVIEGLAEYHPDRMREYISSGGMKSATMREAGLVGSNSKNTAAALLDLAPNVPAGEVRDSFLSSVSYQLSEQGDLDRAWAALQDIHPSIERITAMRNYGNGRAKKSIADTTAWLGSLPPGADRDAAIQGFTWHVDEAQPQMAIEWAAAISDKVYRQDAVQSTFNTWHKNNAKAAEAWLNAAGGLSADEKARLMEKVSKN